MVSFQRLRKPNSDITPTISTICSSVQCLRSSANISSVTALGTEAAARAKSSVAFRSAIKRVRLILPDRRELFVFDAEVQGAAGGVRHAILASRGAARHVRDDALEAAIDFALRVPHGGGHLRQCLRQFGLALHDEYAVRNEAEILSHRLELLLEFGRMVRGKRLDSG